MLEQWIKENVTLEDDGTVAVVNDDVWILPPRTFSNMTKLKKVILPAELRKIGSCFFRVLWVGSSKYSTSGCHY